MNLQAANVGKMFDKSPIFLYEENNLYLCTLKIITFFKVSVKIMERILNIDTSANNAFFLWGARKTGKTTFLRDRFKDAIYIDLLKTNTAQKYELKPDLLREEITANEPALIIIDERF